MDLRELIVQVLSNFGTEAKPDWSVGSGFVVGEDLVLTAAHNIGSGELLVRWPGTDEQPGEELPVRELLAGEPDHVDLALLTVPDLGGPVEPTQYGDVVTNRAAVVSDCWAIGFPRYKELPGEGKLRLTVPSPTMPHRASHRWPPSFAIVEAGTPAVRARIPALDRRVV